jgi:alkylation response protein AidB-like acyl-CoA dehydrogenase
VIDFTLTDEQELLRSTARTLLSKECPTSLVRATIDDPAVAGPLWDQLRDFVALGDGPLVDHCLFLEETGAVCAPGPFFVTSALAVPLLRAAGVDWDGTSALAVAADHPALPYVLDADTADGVVTVIGSTVELVARVDAAERVEWLDLTRRAFTIDLAARGPASSPNGVDVETGWRRATIAAAAEMVGVARWLLHASVEHAKERVQFGRPIGSFQAVQHKLADMALEVERATSAVYYAAMAFDDDPRGDEAVRAAHVAKAAAGAAATRCAKDGIQVHGGIGYTWEHDLHLFLRRAYAMEHVLGTTAWHHDRLATAMFDR